MVVVLARIAKIWRCSWYICRHESKEMSRKRQIKAKKALWKLLVEQADGLLVSQADRDARGLVIVVSVVRYKVSAYRFMTDCNKTNSRTGITIFWGLQALTPT